METMFQDLTLAYIMILNVTKFSSSIWLNFYIFSSKYYVAVSSPVWLFLAISHLVSHLFNLKPDLFKLLLTVQTGYKVKDPIALE